MSLSNLNIPYFFQAFQHCPSLWNSFKQQLPSVCLRNCFENVEQLTNTRAKWRLRLLKPLRASASSLWSDWCQPEGTTMNNV